MIAQLTGTVAAVGEAYAVVDVHGVMVSQSACKSIMILPKSEMVRRQLDQGAAASCRRGLKEAKEVSEDGNRP